MSASVLDWARVIASVEDSMTEALRVPESVTMRPGLAFDRVWLDVTWDAGLEVFEALNDREHGGCELPARERSAILDLRWSHNDGCLKASVWNDHELLASRSLETITRAELIGAWEYIFGWPYNGELDGIAA